MEEEIPEKVREQIRSTELPTSGNVPFRPKLSLNHRGDRVIEKAEVLVGPKRGKRGYVDVEGRIWVRDYAHGDVPDHWDVQIDGGREYFRVDEEGTIIIS